jgi:threonine dehydratase
MRNRALNAPATARARFGAVALAALLQEGARHRRRVGVVLSGGNVDAAVFAPILAGG